MHCPHCNTESPHDPFVCTGCGRRLFAFLDQPFGPGTGIRTDGGYGQPWSAPGGTAPYAVPGVSQQPPPVPASAPPTVPDSGAGPGQFPGTAPGQFGPVGPRRPGQTGSGQISSTTVIRVLIALFVSVVLISEWPPGALILLGVVGLVIWRWPRLPWPAFIGLLLVGTMMLWIMADFFDDVVDDILDVVVSIGATPTPYPTETPVRPPGTPTLDAGARVATATAVAVESRTQVARAQARWLRGDFVTARAEIDRALALDQNRAEAYNIRALIKIASGDAEGALRDADQAVSRTSSDTNQDTRAYALLKLGRYTDAIDIYNRLIRAPIADEQTEALLGRGVALYALGRTNDARSDLELGLRLVPNKSPDPQLDDLERIARGSLDQIRGGQPAASPLASPSPSPVVPR